MIVWLGHSQDGVDYTIFTTKPKWVRNPATGGWHWRGKGCSVPGLSAHAVKRLLGVEFNVRAKDLVKLELEVVSAEHHLG